MAGNIVLLELKNGIKINWIFSNARMFELELRRSLITFVGQIIKISLSLKGRGPARKAHLSMVFWGDFRHIRTEIPLCVSGLKTIGWPRLSGYHMMCQHISNARLKGELVSLLLLPFPQLDVSISN